MISNMPVLRLKVPDRPKAKPSWLAGIILLLFAPSGVYILPAIGVFLLVRRAMREARAYKLKRFHRYMQFFNRPDMTFSVTDIASALGVPKSEVRGDVRQMISENMFTVAPRFSDDGNLILFGNADGVETAFVSQEELDARLRAEKARSEAEQARGEAERARRQAEAAHREAEMARREVEAARAARHATRGKKADAPIGMTAQEARAFQVPAEIKGDSDIESVLECLSVLNSDIDHEGVSKRIDRISSLTRDIMLRSKDPAHPQDVRLFMAYYLPTTVRLLQSYALLEEQSYQGGNITAARAEIERTLDTVIQGFEKKLDSMFSEDALDITSDASVLETMLKKDGLASSASPFRVSKNSDRKGQTMPM